jgi:hypothetical protein
MTVIRPADMDALQEALDNNNVSVVLAMFFTTVFGANLFIHNYPNLLVPVFSGISVLY